MYAYVRRTQYKFVGKLTDAVIKSKLESLLSITEQVFFDEAIADVVRNVKMEAFRPDQMLDCVFSCCTLYILRCVSDEIGILSRRRKKVAA